MTTYETLDLTVIEIEPSQPDARAYAGCRDLLSLYQRDVTRHRLLGEDEVVELA